MISDKLKTKEDVHDFFTNYAGRICPPLELTPIDFYLDVYRGAKKLLVSNSSKMKVKRYNEFRTEWTLLQVKNDSICR